MSSATTERTRKRKTPAPAIANVPGMQAIGPAMLAPRPLPAGLHPVRAWHITENERKWVNGTTLHYAFFNRNRDGKDGAWIGAAAQKAAVRGAFQAWKDSGIGLEFCEVTNREDAELRIGFMADDGCWSCIGRDAIDLVNDADERTMNFDRDLTTPAGWQAALRQIGQALGFRTIENIRLDDAKGEEGLPSALAAFARQAYPPLTRSAEKELLPGHSLPLAVLPGEQANFRIRPLFTRPYTIQLFGACDAVMVLFEELGGLALYDEMDGETEFLAGSDNSGTDNPAVLRVRLHRDREYVLRVRVYFRKTSHALAVLLW